MIFSFRLLLPKLSLPQVQKDLINNMYKLLITLLFMSLSFTACSKNSPDKDTKPAPAPKKAAVKTEATPAEIKVDESTSKAPVINKKVYFTSPSDKAEVTSPVKLVFGVDGMSIRPAGQDIEDRTSGHHHLIIDAEGIPAGTVVPMDKQHIHYGKGQTSATIELTPGQHTLRLQFADGAHLSYGPDMSSAITVTVK